MDAKKIAQVCHEANRALQTVNPDVNNPVSEPWDLVKAEIRESAVSGVEAVLANPEQTPEQSHEGWMAFKVEKGWVYGPVKDEEKKTHPCLVPYADLPAKEKVKDELFQAIVRTLADL
jgi:hypothetical protein